jgi:hypothetical protein
MPYLWRQVLYPATPDSGSNHTYPFVTVNSDGEIIPVSELLNNYGSTTYDLTHFFAGFDYFGNQNVTQQAVDTENLDTPVETNFGISNYYGLVTPGDGGDLYRRRGRRPARLPAQSRWLRHAPP